MLSLLNASLLPWLAAASIPLLIHLLTRRPQQRLDLPTLRFLQRTLAHQSRLMRWRHWLLLLLRTIAVLALILAFTKPTLDSPLAARGAERTGVVFILDNSASMSYNTAGLTSLARAKNEAFQALHSLKTGDKANIILCSAQPTALLSQPSDDLTRVQALVRTAALTQEQANPAAAISLAVEQLAKTNTKAKRLYIFSDFQRTNWADAKFDSVPAGTKILFVNTNTNNQTNLGLTTMRIRPAVPRIGETVSVSCEVFNSSNGTQTVPLTLSLSNGKRYNQTITLGPHSSATANFPLTFNAPQRIECTASIPRDNLAVDDTRRAVIDLRQIARVVLLTDENTAKASGAAFFLTRALHPDTRSAVGFQVFPTKPAALNNPRLQSADIVMVCNAPQMPPVQFEALARYVVGGGNLVWFLYGDRVQEQLPALGKHLPKAEGMPLKIMEVRNLSGNGRGYTTLAEARYESPLLKAFKDPAAADLGKIQFHRLCVTGEVAPRAETLLKFEDGTPAAVLSGAGSGHLLLLNMSPAPAWSDLARQEAFVPLIHEFLKGLLARDAGGRDFSPGNVASATVETTGKSANSLTRVTCTGPLGGVPVTADASTGSVVLDTVKQSGFYYVSASGQPVAVIPVNVTADETDLRPVDPRELESQRQKQLSYVAGAGDAGNSVSDISRGHPLWHYLFFLALLALFAEQRLSMLKPKLSNKTTK